MNANLKISLQGGILFAVLLIISSFFGDPTAAILLVPALVGIWLIISKVRLSILAGEHLTWGKTLRIMVSGFAVFIGLLLCNVIAFVVSQKVEFYFLLSLAIPSILYVTLKSTRHTWLYAGFSQVIGSGIILVPLTIFPNLGGHMAGLLFIAYAIFGFFLGLMVGLMKTPVIFIRDRWFPKRPAI
ncbi:MAG: hypothetical protein HY208_00955 [Nitrospirae bacterium]|nr:hypothetical protein [Nitrospirota bacterium]